MKSYPWVCIFVLLLLSSSSFAQSQFTAVDNNGRIMTCWDLAGQRYNIDPWLLMAIAKVESSFNPSAINKSNRNGSVDIGLMQINSFWFPKLQRMGIRRQDLFNPCTNIFVGAWVLSQKIQQYGHTLNAIGAYNARSPHLRIKYIQRVQRAYNQLIAQHERHIANTR